MSGPIRLLVVLLACSLFAGCSSVRYAQQAWEGHREVMRLSVPIDTLLADPQTDPALAQRLAQAKQARRFASDVIGLPDNASYTRFTALPRPYVIWNLFVTPELSLEPVEHCYLLAGCLAYRGMFDESKAQAQARMWREQGMDVHVGGVPAYSTLGWYDDPLLSSMLHWGDDYVAELIFHELAHQHFYVRDDTAFNESFASFVGQEGLRQWRASRGLPPPDSRMERQRRGFIDLMLAARDDLIEVYASDRDEHAMRAAKSARFDQLRAQYRRWRDEQWGGSELYDSWMTPELNNASLLPFGLYDQWIPAFAALFDQVDGSWPRFFDQVRQLGQAKPQARQARLQQLAGQAAPAERDYTEQPSPRIGASQ